jgi:hypothetical protein
MTVAMFENSYVVNVLSNFITLALLVFLGFVVQRLAGRRALLKFFRIQKTKRINLYLSNLSVVAGGALGVDRKPRSFGETAIPFAESQFIGLFQRLFNRLVPGLEGQPGPLRWLSISDVDVSPLVSPLQEESIDKSTTAISLGSPAYNVVSRWAEDGLGAIGRFAHDNRALAIEGLPPLTDTRQGFIQRVVDSGGTTCFYAAGCSTLGTIGAAYFLATKWRYLHGRFGDKISFCVLLQMDGQDFRKCAIVAERDASEPLITSHVRP